MGLDLLHALRNSDAPVDFPGHYIGGSFVGCDRGVVIKDAVNPSRGSVLFTIRMDKSQLGQALDIAEANRKNFETKPTSERLELITRFRQALVDYQSDVQLAMQIEWGKPKWEAEQEFAASLEFLDHIIETGEGLFEQAVGLVGTPNLVGKVDLRPVGTVLAQIPFSRSCAAFVKFFSISALAGCPLIAMPSAHAALLSHLMAHIVHEIDAPKGMLSVLCGNFEMFRLAAQDRRVKAILYRGSREHCITIRKESYAHIERPLVLQSGGKNAVILHPSCNVTEAVDTVLYGVLKSAGQLCTSTSRAFIHRSQLAEFVNLMVTKIRNIEIGPTDQDDSNPTMGPLYSRKAVDKFLRFQTMAQRESNKTVLWGKTLDLGTGGFFVSPGLHILGSLDEASAYQSNVLLFPDLAVYEYDDVSEAVEGVNRTDASYVVSVIGREEEWLKDVRFTPPNVLVNLPTVEKGPSHAVAGRGYCGVARQVGYGLLQTLTYPVSRVTGVSFKEFNKAWPAR